MEINDDILISYLLGESTEQEKHEMDNWRVANPINETRYQKFKTIWETSLSLQFESEVDAIGSLQRFKEKVVVRNTQENKVINLWQTNIWIKIAAVLLLLIGISWAYFLQQAPTELNIITANKVKIDTLSDGSILTVNKNTQIHLPQKFNGAQRLVTLDKGEAFFNVSHNKVMPFVIHTAGSIIRVVGTSFNVKNKNGIVEVIVETGIVQVNSKGKSVKLTHGEKLVIAKNDSNLLKVTNPDQLYKYYRSKEFVADNTPLWRMVQVLNEAYDSHIIIGRTELNNLPLNTTFKNESLDDILQVIARTFNIRIERKDQTILLK
jgi:transmembrane sensor